MKRFALTALALAVAFVAGRLTLAAATHTERVIERQPIQQRVVQTSSPSSSLTADDVRSIVNEALAAQPPAAAEPQRPIDTVALSRAQSVVATGIADGRWSTDDRERLGAVIDRLNREQAREVMTSLFRELNAGRVQLDTDGPPT